MTTLISGIIMALSGLVFIGSLIARTMPTTAKVGDTFGHINPGIGGNPGEPPKPFVEIYIVKEIRDGKALKEVLVLNVDGSTQRFEAWDTAFGLGEHDTKLER